MRNLHAYVYLSFYSIRIASLQGNHGYFFYEVINKNKNKIRRSWKIYRIDYSCLSFYCTLQFVQLPFLCYTTLNIGHCNICQDLLMIMSEL